MKRRHPIPAIVLACSLAAIPLSQAQSPARIENAPDPLGDRALAAAGFFESHPDLKYRNLGALALREQAHGKALGYLRRASRYADKPSQAMVAEMYWSGKGVPLDRAMGYVWMDLAAERGYPELVAKRERYWAELTEEERGRAMSEGRQVFDHYGDEIAQRRIATELRRDRRKIVGSRTGFAGNTRLYIKAPGGASVQTGPGMGEHPAAVVEGPHYYASVYWEPERYQAWHEVQWNQRVGRTVKVGELQNIGKDEAPGEVSPGPRDKPSRR